ncbi:MAG: uridine kinase [Nocardioidaceae bacterium]|nr:uridine kinase [Nocardioidaceae bacterium]
MELLLSLVQEAKERLGSTKLVAIDGPAGSGKTILASHLHTSLQHAGLIVTTLHLDDLYEGWTGLESGLETRLADQVLHPLAGGRAAYWQRYDWHARAFAEWVNVPPPEVLILEGCGSGAQAYTPYTSLLVWIEAGQEERIARGIQRDGPGVLANWLAWMDREAAHFAANRTRARADLHLST